MNDPKLGLYRLLDCAQQERVTGELSVCFADLYDALSDTKDLTRELEKTIDRLLYGEKDTR
ncbi:MAG: hypothetical protein KGJ34_02685 [Patescibacteria group bacterium]|nr:hypothetical protein [Patescibacteria group bacterium]